MGVVEDLIGLVPGAAMPVHVAKVVGVLLENDAGMHDVLIVAGGYAIQTLIRQMPWPAFRARWAFIRQLMSLQGRLLVEQVLWGMGPPYRSLLTGFEPVEISSSWPLNLPPRRPPSEREPNVTDEVVDDGLAVLHAFIETAGTGGGGARDDWMSFLL